MSKDKSINVQSPCISNCCLNDEDVCVGCYRYIDEITGWHSADNLRRMEILKNAQQRKEISQLRNLKQ